MQAFLQFRILSSSSACLLEWTDRSVSYTGSTTKTQPRFVIVPLFIQSAHIFSGCFTSGNAPPQPTGLLARHTRVPTDTPERRLHLASMTDTNLSIVYGPYTILFIPSSAA
jgi:hypothetical protein